MPSRFRKEKMGHSVHNRIVCMRQNSARRKPLIGQRRNEGPVGSRIDHARPWTLLCIPGADSIGNFEVAAFLKGWGWEDEPEKYKSIVIASVFGAGRVRNTQLGQLVEKQLVIAPLQTEFIVEDLTNLCCTALFSACFLIDWNCLRLFIFCLSMKSRDYCFVNLKQEGQNSTGIVFRVCCIGTSSATCRLLGVWI